MSRFRNNHEPVAASAAAVAAAFGLAGLLGAPAAAVPSYGDQTGQPCQACHVGGFGPQLTPFGQQFKLRGYTLRAKSFKDVAPVSAMVIESYVRTNTDQAEPPAEHTSVNDNVAFDQASLFFAAGLGRHAGAFVQATYDGVGRSYSWDNVDLRWATDATLAGKSVIVGATLNNSPGVQDVWNTLPAWGYPYTDSAIAPGPAASPVIAGGLAQSVVGASAYALWNASIYAEAGLYITPGASFLSTMGVGRDDTNQINGAAPYFRATYQRFLGGGTLEAGVFGLSGELYPGRDRSAGIADRFNDIGLDASFQKALGAGDTISVNARYTHESRRLGASEALGLAENPRNTLEDLRADVSYYRSRIGVTLAGFDTWGSRDAILYAPSATGSPDSSGLMLQLDYTPFGQSRSTFGGRLNVRLGLQYTAYAQFDGASGNYDGQGRNASDNDTLRVFAWFAF
jgi:hypothetical protein